MPVYYSLVARGKVIVCDYSPPGIKLESESVDALDNLGPSDIERCQHCGELLIFTLVDDGLTYLCVTDREFNYKDAFTHLKEIKRHLKSEGLHSRAKSKLSGPYSLRTDFSKTLERLTSQACGDRVALLQNRVEVVQGAMKENLNKMTQRGESIVDLEGRSEYLAQSSTEFQRTATKLRKKMMWKSVKLWIILLVILAVIVIVIVVAIVIGLLVTKKL